MANDDAFRFLRDRTAYWLGVKCLQDRKVLRITDPIKKEFMKMKTYFNQTVPANADENTKRYHRIFNEITIGDRT